MIRTFILTISLVYSIICNVSYSQEFWEQLYFPDSTHIRDLVTNSQGDLLIAAGTTNVIGGVYRSVDNAQTWEVMPGPLL
ncbi:MAG: hypothetical protein JEZ03_17560 [Bacteroidales bacterium]|nr:hypothetical protein [Bacteroidales bacterium]